MVRKIYGRPSHDPMEDLRQRNPEWQNPANNPLHTFGPTTRTSSSVHAREKGMCSRELTKCGSAEGCGASRIRAVCRWVKPKSTGSPHTAMAQNTQSLETGGSTSWPTWAETPSRQQADGGATSTRWQVDGALLAGTEGRHTHRSSSRGTPRPVSSQVPRRAVVALREHSQAAQADASEGQVQQVIVAVLTLGADELQARERLVQDRWNPSCVKQSGCESGPSRGELEEALGELELPQREEENPLDFARTCMEDAPLTAAHAPAPQGPRKRQRAMQSVGQGEPAPKHTQRPPLPLPAKKVSGHFFHRTGSLIWCNVLWRLRRKTSNETRPGLSWQCLSGTGFSTSSAFAETATRTQARLRSAWQHDRRAGCEAGVGVARSCGRVSAGSESGAYDLDVLVSATRTQDREASVAQTPRFGVWGPRENPGRRAKIQSSAPFPRTGPWLSTFCWSRATRGVPPRPLWVSSLRCFSLLLASFGSQAL